MKNLSRLGLKLLGILGLYWSATSLSTVVGLTIVSIPTMVASKSLSAILTPILSEAFWLVTTVAGFFLAWIMLARTESIIQRFDFPEDPALPRIDCAPTLRVGLILLGVYGLLDAIPALGYTIFSGISWSSPGFYYDYGRLAHIIAPAMKFIVACILIGRSRAFSRSIFPTSETQPPAPEL